MGRTWAEHGQNMGRTGAEHVQNACSFHGNSMNNLSSYCGLIDGKIRASDKDLPVPVHKENLYLNLDQKTLA